MNTAGHRDVSIIIVNWNTRGLLRNCLESIYRETSDILFEVFVIDNASEDKSAEMVTSDFPQVRLIANNTNCGFAAANNQGLRLARGQYVLLLNPDTIILDGAIQKSLRFAVNLPKVGVLGCQVLQGPGRIQQTCFSFPTPLHLFLSCSGLSRAFPQSQLGRPELRNWDRTTQREVDVVSGMFMLVSSLAIEQVGLLDEDYFVYGEETDWCFRFRRAGWMCMFAPVAQIIHLDGGGKSTSQVKPRMYVQLQKSLVLFQKKNFGLGAARLATLVLIASNCVRWVCWRMAGFIRRDDNLRARASLSAAALKFHMTGVEPQ